MTDPTVDELGTEILRALGGALAKTDPVPSWVSEAARAAFGWRNLDAELAQLVYDSAGAGAGVGMRAETADRQMTFEAPGVEIEVMVVNQSRRLVGQLVPPQAATVTLTVGDQSLTAEADSLGRFGFEGVSPGRVRLSIRTASGRVVATEWVLI